MKFMGSKAGLLGGYLGRALLRECEGQQRFIDLFAGSGSVSHFVAEKMSLPVLSFDLQLASVVLSGAITGRDAPFTDHALLVDWCKQADEDLAAGDLRDLWRRYSGRSRGSVLEARRVCGNLDPGELGFTSHYGGHYFSPVQALELDYLSSRLPTEEPHRTVALAALIHAASRCAASPGHTAQPFQPNSRLLPFIRTAWNRSFLDETQTALESITRRHGLVKGVAVQLSAEEAVEGTQEGDVAFCDPPYSAVQYSRFYHVLEGIARGGWSAVRGQGRAPEISQRASSDFSLRRRSDAAMRDLLGGLYSKGCSKVIITFPNAEASNGLSARSIASHARAAGWRVRKSLVDSTHSTLGGINDGGIRGSRRDVREALFVLGR